MTTRERVGSVDVDAGVIWVGDPCYVMGDDASSRVHDWSAFCDLLDKNGQHTGTGGVTAPLGDGTGLAVTTAWGDGTYPVYVTRTAEGRIASVTVEFEPPS